MSAGMNAGAESNGLSPIVGGTPEEREKAEATRASAYAECGDTMSEIMNQRPRAPWDLNRDRQMTMQTRARELFADVRVETWQSFPGIYMFLVAAEKEAMKRHHDAEDRKYREKVARDNERMRRDDERRRRSYNCYERSDDEPWTEATAYAQHLRYHGREHADAMQRSYREARESAESMRGGCAPILVAGLVLAATVVSSLLA